MTKPGLKPKKSAPESVFNHHNRLSFSKLIDFNREEAILYVLLSCFCLPLFFFCHFLVLSFLLHFPQVNRKFHAHKHFKVFGLMLSCVSPIGHFIQNKNSWKVVFLSFHYTLMVYETRSCLIFLTGSDLFINMHSLFGQYHKYLETIKKRKAN